MAWLTSTTVRTYLHVVSLSFLCALYTSLKFLRAKKKEKLLFLTLPPRVLLSIVLLVDLTSLMHFLTHHERVSSALIGQQLGQWEGLPPSTQGREKAGRSDVDDEGRSRRRFSVPKSDGRRGVHACIYEKERLASCSGRVCAWCVCAGGSWSFRVMLQL